MSTIQSEVGKMTAISGNTVRVLEVSAILHAIRRAILRYSVDADEASYQEAVDKEQKTIALLQDSAKATLSEERAKLILRQPDRPGRRRAASAKR